MTLLLQLLGVVILPLAAVAAAKNISDPKPQAAAAPLLDHRVWREEHGLPVDRVKAIVQTRDGYLWLGTPAGLARFDGVRFTVFNRANTSAFRSNDCWILSEDDDGGLWIATAHGLVSYANGRFRFFGKEDGLTDEFIGTMTFGRRTGLWVGTGSGLSRHYQGRWTTYLISEGGLRARVTRLHEDAVGKCGSGQSVDCRFSIPQHPDSPRESRHIGT